MGLLEVILTVVVLLGVALAILLFERPRAERIRRDVGEEARQRARKKRDGGP